MEIGAWAEWVAAVLSGIAILASLYIAFKVSKQSQRIAENQTNLERESYVSSRMQDLVDHARETIAEAQTIASLTSPRLDDLLGAYKNEHNTLVERRNTVFNALSRLRTQVELLRVFAVTMPRLGTNDNGAHVDLENLMDEGAWLYGDALHASILFFESDAEEIDLSNDQSVVDALLNGSFVNLPTRLLSDCVGKDPDKIPYFSEPGSPWPEVYARRKAVLLAVVMSRKSWVPDSLAEAGTWSLSHTLDRFQDALILVLRAWEDI